MLEENLARTFSKYFQKNIVLHFQEDNPSPLSQLLSSLPGGQETAPAGRTGGARHTEVDPETWNDLLYARGRSYWTGAMG